MSSQDRNDRQGVDGDPIPAMTEESWIGPHSAVRGNPDCPDPDCGYYPYYGVAPHECFYKKGPQFQVGQSTLLPKSRWPANFVLELLEGETEETVQYPNACGVYYCPTCLHGKPANGATSRPPQTDRLTRDDHHPTVTEKEGR